MIKQSPHKKWDIDINLDVQSQIICPCQRSVESWRCEQHTSTWKPYSVKISLLAFSPARLWILKEKCQGFIRHKSRPSEWYTSAPAKMIQFFTMRSRKTNSNCYELSSSSQRLSKFQQRRVEDTNMSNHCFNPGTRGCTSKTSNPRS